MNLGTLSGGLLQVLKSLGSGIVKHKVPICFGVGLAAGAGAVVCAATGTVKAMHKIEAKKESEQKETLTKTEVVKTCWACYLPSAALFALCLLGVIGGAKMQADQIVALGAALTASEKALLASEKTVADYEQALSDLDSKKAEETKELVEKRRSEPEPALEAKEVPTAVNSAGKIKVYDPISGKEFYSDMNTLIWAMNQTCQRINQDGSCSLAEFFEFLDICVGECAGERGWTRDDGLPEVRLKGCDLSGYSTEEPYYTLRFTIPPKIDPEGSIMY